MKFIGQERIWKELTYLIPEFQAGRNLNILIRAPSGCGKTKLAIIVANSIDNNSVSYVLAEKDRVDFPQESRVVIVDEIHELQEPEILYPVMDSNRHIFILCSNEYGELKEPLVNRCIDFIFDPYTIEEMSEIIYRDFLEYKINLPADCVNELALNANGTPRIARQFVTRLSIIFKSTQLPETREDIRNILLEYFQIEDGLNPLHRRYLDFLSKSRRASLDLISFGTRIDRNTIRKEIEPVLLDKLLIRITSKGREIL